MNAIWKRRRRRLRPAGLACDRCRRRAARPGQRRNGLSQAEAQRRLAQHGANVLPAPRKHGPWRRFLLQFHNVLIYALLASAAVTAWLGHWVDAAVILARGADQCARSASSRRAAPSRRWTPSASMLSPHAQVLRDGRRPRCRPRTLVARRHRACSRPATGCRPTCACWGPTACMIDESVLTGESQPVEKATEPVAAEARWATAAAWPIPARWSTYGQGAGLVVATGAATEIGRISAMLGRVSSAHHAAAPADRRVQRAG